MTPTEPPDAQTTGAAGGPEAPASGAAPQPSDAVKQCLACYDADEQPPQAVERAAVKQVLADLSRRAPGHSVEVRVPPHAAVQVVAGVRHRRGTPPALVQLKARTLLQLATGARTWADAVESGDIRASGERSDLSEYFPPPLA
jgi:hypothetical protein